MPQYSLMLTSVFSGIRSAARIAVVLILFLSALYTYTRTVAPAPAYAATSSHLNFQARLLSNSGQNVPDGDYNIEFNLYNVSSGGTAEWTETRVSGEKVRVANGYMSVALGEVTAFPTTIDWDQDHWLTMNVGGTGGSPAWDGEMTPRLKLTAVPYAFQAKQASMLNQTQGANTGILDFLNLTADRTINLPDKDGTLCIAGDSDCVDVATTGTTATTSSNSGLEISADGLRLLGGCSDAQMLRWNDTTDRWECSSGSGGSFGVEASDGSVTTTVSSGLEFGGDTNSDDEFIVSAQGGGVTRIRLGDKVMTIDNYASTLDGVYVNAGESPATGDISGSFSGGLTIGSNAVALGTDTTGDYVSALGTLTGLSVTGNTGEGSTPALSILYGSSANTAVQGNVQITCAAGSGNLSGGGTTITLGSGGTCGNISISDAPSFATSVTTPLISSGAGLTLATGTTAGADDLTFQTAGSEKLRLMENGDLRFEKGTNDVTFSVDAPASAATYTFSGATGTVLTTANFASGLDSTYVNVGENPTAGDISGSFTAGFTIGANTVALGTDTTGDYISSLGTLTGLSVSGNTGEGSTPALSVTYGSSASTAVQGNVQITCAAGTGDLSGGGTTITLGSGGTCGQISISESPVFDTSVTTPLLASTAGLTLSSGTTAGADDVVFQTAGTEKMRLMENGDLRFEKGANDVTFALSTPGAAATYTFSGATGVVLTSSNFGTNGLDAAYVNVSENPAAGDISGSFTDGFTIGSDAVELGANTTGNYVATIGTVTGLTLSNNSGEGSTPGLSVNYGSLANTAVEGDTQITCAAGAGNLSGGGDTITLGSGGTCSTISISATPTFTTVNAATFTNNGGLTLSTTGSNDLTLTSGSGTVNLNASTVATTAGLTYNLNSVSNTVFTLSNSGAGTSSLNLSDGGLQVGGTEVLTSGQALANLTGITSSGTVTFSSLNAGGIVKAVASTGGLTLATAGTDYENPLTFSNGLTRTGNSIGLGGTLAANVDINLNSNTLTITGSGSSAFRANAGGGIEVLTDAASALAVRSANGSITYFDVSPTGDIVQVGSSTANANPILFALNSFNNATDPTGVNGSMYYNNARGKMRCFENGAWDNCVGSVSVRSFIDTTGDTIADNNTTGYWDTAAENNNAHPNITLSQATGKAIMGIVTIEMTSTGNQDLEFTARVERGIGSVPTCNSGTQVGGNPGVFATNTGGLKSSTTTFIDVPDTSQPVYYVVCADTATVGTTGTVSRIRVTLQEVNNSN